jgi:hypothetical protein
VTRLALDSPRGAVKAHKHKRTPPTQTRSPVTRRYSFFLHFNHSQGNLPVAHTRSLPCQHKKQAQAKPTSVDNTF